MFHVSCAIQMGKKIKQTFNENDNDCECMTCESMPGFSFTLAPPFRPADTDSKMKHFGSQKKKIMKKLDF